MRINFVYSAKSSLFFLIDNLSEHSGYERHEYNVRWLEDFGQLNTQEKRELPHYNNLVSNLVKNGLYKNLRGLFFSDSNKPCRALIETAVFLSLNDKKRLINVCDIFKPRFKKFIKKYRPLLENNTRVLSNDYQKRKANISKAIRTLKYFYGADRIPNNIFCYLMVMPLDHQRQGGKAIAGDTVAIEAEYLYAHDQSRLDRLWLTIVHEMAHSLFEDKKYKTRLKTYWSRNFSSYEKKRVSWELFRESVTTTITRSPFVQKLVRGRRQTPNDEIYNRLSREKYRFNDPDVLKNYVSLKTAEITILYLTNRKKIDETFLDKIGNVIKKYPENLFRDIDIWKTN